MRTTLHESVRKTSHGLVEVTDLIVETEDPAERERLDMLKARAVKCPVAIIPGEMGRIVVRLVKPL